MGSICPPPCYLDCRQKFCVFFFGTGLLRPAGAGAVPALSGQTPRALGLPRESLARVARRPRRVSEPDHGCRNNQARLCTIALRADPRIAYRISEQWDNLTEQRRVSLGERHRASITGQTPAPRRLAAWLSCG